MVTHHYTCRNCNKPSAIASEDSSPFPLPLECPKCGQQNRLRFLHTTIGDDLTDTAAVTVAIANLCTEVSATSDTVTATLQSGGGGDFGGGGASGGWPDNQGYDSGGSSDSSSSSND